MFITKVFVRHFASRDGENTVKILPPYLFLIGACLNTSYLKTCINTSYLRPISILFKADLNLAHSKRILSESENVSGEIMELFQLRKISKVSNYRPYRLQ